MQRSSSTLPPVVSSQRRQAEVLRYVVCWRNRKMGRELPRGGHHTYLLVRYRKSRCCHVSTPSGLTRIQPSSLHSQQRYPHSQAHNSMNGRCVSGQMGRTLWLAAMTTKKLCHRMITIANLMQLRLSHLTDRSQAVITPQLQAHY